MKQPSPTPDEALPGTLGAELARMREERGLSQKWVAEQAAISPEYLNRIERKNRIPRRAVIERLAEILRISAVQRALLLPELTDDVLPSALRAADSREEVERLLRRAGTLATFVPQDIALTPLGGTALDHLGTVISGGDHILEAMITLLRVAAGASAPSGKTISLVLFEVTTLLNAFPHLHSTWSAALTMVLQRGWSLRHLWRLDGTRHETLLLVTDMLQLLGLRGAYTPYALQVQTDDRAWLPAQMLIVPGIVGLTFLPTPPGVLPDTAFLVREPTSLQALAHHERQACEQSAQRILRVFPASSAGRRNFDAAIHRIEADIGPRRLVKGDISVLHIPEEITRERLAARLAAEEKPQLRLAKESEFAQMLYHRAERQRAFEAQLAVHRFRDIYPKSALRTLAKSGKVPRDAWLEGDSALRLDERYRIIAQLRRHLEHPNYDLALVDDDHPALTRAVWEVKGAQTVLLELFRPIQGIYDAPLEEIDIIIHEPLIVSAFRDYFDTLWDGLSRRSKDKIHHRAFLTQLLDSIESVS